MRLIRLGETARSEFMAWCAQRPAAAVRVPVWVAHEFHRHITDGTVRSNIQKTVSEAQAKYDEFVRLASERADVMTCRPTRIHHPTRALIRACAPTRELR